LNTSADPAKRKPIPYASTGLTQNISSNPAPPRRGLTRKADTVAAMVSSALALRR